MRCGRTAVVVGIVTGLIGSAPAFVGARQASSEQAGVTSPQHARPSRTGVNGFSVVLVIADLQAATGADDVPPAARQALADMKEFLPYKSYKLLDAAWIMGTGRTTSRLRGPEDRDYEVDISSASTFKEKPPTTQGAASTAVVPDDNRIYVQFSLREHAGSDELPRAVNEVEREKGAKAGDEAETVALRARLNEVEEELRKARAKQNPSSEVRQLEKQLADLRARLDAESRGKFDRLNRARLGTRGIMNTSFTMDVGETVVVGTSRLRGNSKALIALLTAVPPRGSRTSR